MATSSRVELAKKIKSYISNVPFLKYFDISVENAKFGSITLRIDPAPALLNHFNAYQAGVILTLCEVTGGALCGTFLDLSRSLLITKKCDTHFNRSINVAMFSFASIDVNIIPSLLDELERKRKLDLQLDVFIKTAEGETVAKSSNLYYLRRDIPKMFTAIPYKKKII